MEKREKTLFKTAGILLVIYLICEVINAFRLSKLGVTFNFYTLIPLVFIAVVLFMKRKDTLLGAALAINSAFIIVEILQGFQYDIFSFELPILWLLLSVALCFVIFFEKQITQFKKIIILLSGYIPSILILLNIKAAWSFTTVAFGDFLGFGDYWNIILTPFILDTIKQISFMCISAILAHNTYNEKCGKLNRVGSIGLVTLPAGIVLGFLIALISSVIYDRIYFFNGFFFTGALWIMAIAMIVIGVFLLPLAILYPANPRIATNNGSAEDGYINLGKHIVLCLFTFGIWNWIWIYRTTAYLNRTPNAEQYNPTSKLLLCIFVPFYSIYWYYKHGGRIDALSRSRNMNQSDMATMCLILGIFIPIVACILMQDRINSICAATNTSNFSYPQQEEKQLENIKQLKELLDSGVITQEEFEAKKKQLLGL